MESCPIVSLWSRPVTQGLSWCHMSCHDLSAVTSLVSQCSPNEIPTLMKDNYIVTGKLFKLKLTLTLDNHCVALTTIYMIWDFISCVIFPIWCRFWCGQSIKVVVKYRESQHSTSKADWIVFQTLIGDLNFVSKSLRNFQSSQKRPMDMKKDNGILVND